MIASLVRPHRRSMAAFGGALAIATALPILASLSLAQFVRLAAHGAPMHQLAPYGVAYALIGLAASGVTILVTWRATLLAWQITNELRNDLAAYVLRADLSFHRDRTPGELVTRVDSDITSMTDFLATVVSRVIAIVAVAVAAVLTLAVVEPRLAPALAIGLTIVGTVTWSQRDAATAATVIERAADAEFMSTVEQYLAGAEDISALGAGAHGVQRAGRTAGVMVAASRGRVKAQMQVQGLVRMSLAAAAAIVIGWGAFSMTRGWVDVAAVVLGFRFVAAVRQPLEHLTWRLQDAQGATGAARRVMELLAEQRVVEAGTDVLVAGPASLHFEGVSLVYDDGDGLDAALDNVDLRVEPGRVLGLIGRSGSGKTSMARLALRLVAPTAGRVLVGGVDLATITDASLRARITAIPQDVQLFPGTVHDNVAMFAPANDADVRQALIDVGLGDWLNSLPDGLTTQLSADTRDDGNRVGLSSGQAQLLALARAMLRHPDVVVLDEATSRVDPATQAAISSAIGRLTKGRTGLVIAHRLETLDSCHDIAVLRDGHLIEHGPRQALADDPTSIYAQLRAMGEESEELS